MLFEESSFHVIPIICGATASGKSDFAMQICKEVSGELVSCDSMQIYKGMDIGTAKPSIEEQEEIRHHLIDIIEPYNEYNVTLFQKDAYRCISDILARKKLPVLCGGTGQYVQALSLGLEFVKIGEDAAIRKRLEVEASEFGCDVLYERLLQIDSEAAAKIHPNNLKRLIRALEIFELTSVPMSEHNRRSIKKGARFPFKIFMLDLDRSILHERINLRVDRMIEAGLLKEVQTLFEDKIPMSRTAEQGIGYKELFSYFNDEVLLHDAVEQIKSRSRQYAKRQITWFSHMANVTKIAPGDISKVLSACQSI